MGGTTIRLSVQANRPVDDLIVDDNAAASGKMVILSKEVIETLH